MNTLETVSESIRWHREKGAEIFAVELEEGEWRSFQNECTTAFLNRRLGGVVPEFREGGIYVFGVTVTPTTRIYDKAKVIELSESGWFSGAGWLYTGRFWQ